MGGRDISPDFENRDSLNAAKKAYELIWYLAD